jgi:glutathione S-transferase
MADLILHHFHVSPFSEKVRLVLGYKGSSWKSVIIPSIMPKPDVVALTGGYRKTPVLQIGADIFCDTALICEVVESLHPTPTLYPGFAAGIDRIVAQWADSTLFWGFIFGPRSLAHTNAGLTGDAAQAFIQDRSGMFVNMAKPQAADAAAARQAYLHRLSDTLGHKPFLFGDAPCIADFAAYHPIWFTRIPEPASQDIVRNHAPSLMAWLDRMQALGHGRSEALSSSEALAIAHASAPMPIGAGDVSINGSPAVAYFHDTSFQDHHGIPLGSTVNITAESFGSERTRGELIAATGSHYTLRRTDPRAGTVHVHFPRIGYLLQRDQAG